MASWYALAQQLVNLVAMQPGLGTGVLIILAIMIVKKK